MTLDIARLNQRLHLREYRLNGLTDAVAKLEGAIAAGMVPNALLVSAKETINRAIDEAVRGYDDETKQYRFKIVSSAHDLPPAIKEAVKLKAYDRCEFLSSMFPLYELLQAAKPLAVKRQDMPKVKSPKQLVDEADQMTCQCCGRGIFAATGTIAHHGYQRPGGGWQTASCSGAKELPFEVSREALGRLIANLNDWEVNAVAALAAIANGLSPVCVQVSDRTKPRDSRTGRHPTKLVELTRGCDVAATGLKGTYDDYLQIDISHRAREIEGIREEIKAQQGR